MADINLTPTLVDGEARIRDIDLAEKLGFGSPVSIRKLIARHRGALEAMGVISTVGKTSSAKGGRPGLEFYLNRKQAIFITAKSETAKAIDITIEIIHRFDEYERGGAPTLASQIDLDLAHFMSLPLDERRERRMLVSETRETIGNITAHNLFQRVIFKTRELSGFQGSIPSLFAAPTAAAVSVTVTSGGTH